MRRGALLLAAAALAGCPHGEAVVSSPAVGRGVTVELPQGWQRAETSLTPNLRDPREALSLATFPLAYRQTACAHVPGSALEDLGPRDAFVTLQERGDGGSAFPPRPAQFGPELGGEGDSDGCTPRTHFRSHWLGFSDGGRRFHVLVAFGPQAPAGVQEEAWRVLDSLRVDPAVRPDWRDSG
ncbi:MAG TPA: hypothetical protein VHF89_13045 [Solirubrobacteraceae bacterium]|nr:hypothetical protein [Solirubrobacteraceae bacterium]